MVTVNTGYVRTVDDIRETLRLAVIKEPELLNVTQIIYSVTDNNIQQCTKLLELDEDLLEIIKTGDSLAFQGNKKDTVVLCTKDKTYDIKEAQTSNSCLVVPNLNLFEQINTDTNERIMTNHNISGVFHKYYEVREGKPRLERLISTLEPTSFKGLEYEFMIPKEHLYDWDKLRSEIQASEDELNKALKEYLITNINGYFRMISFEFEVRSLTLMLDLFEENCWEIDQVDKEVTYESIKELIPECVFDTIFAKYTEASDKVKPDGIPLYRYKEENCCKSLAKVLLTASSVTEYKQFMESWRIGTPEKMKPKEKHLSGVALIMWNSSALQKEVVSFLETDLPLNVHDRFNELFKTKDKWTVEEITPYILRLTTNKMNVNAVLTKYARCSTTNGIKYYSSKHVTRSIVDCRRFNTCSFIKDCICSLENNYLY